MRRTGEFLFIATSRPGHDRRLWATFFGCGYHEYRERWLVDEWFFYMANPLPDALCHFQTDLDTLQQDIARDEAKQRIQARHAELRAYAQQTPQTRRGQPFETLADISDDDGALAEMEDLGDLWDLLAGDD